MNTFTMLPLAKIHANPDQPRKHFDKALLDDLAVSIQTEGLLQPITVRAEKNGTYMIIAGERRWRACSLAGLKEVPCSVVDADDAKVFMLAMMENVARVDMNPMEEARGYQKGLDLGFTPEEMEASLGLIKGDVRWKVKLLRGIPAVQQLVEKGHMATTNGVLISRLEANFQQKALREFQKRKMTSKELGELVDALEMEQNQITMFKPGEVKALSQKARDTAGEFDRALKMIGDGCQIIQELDKKLLTDALAHDGDKADKKLREAVKEINRTVASMRLVRGRVAGKQAVAAV